MPVPFGKDSVLWSSPRSTVVVCCYRTFVLWSQTTLYSSPAPARQPIAYIISPHNTRRQSLVRFPSYSSRTFQKTLSTILNSLLRPNFINRRTPYALTYWTLLGIPKLTGR